MDEMAQSAEATHRADGQLEHAEALAELIRTLCASADEKEWNRNRLGLTFLANSLVASLSAARAAIDEC